MKPFYVGLAAVAVAGIGVVAWQVKGSPGGTGATQPIQVDIDDAELARVQGISIGRDDAPVVIYEFADYTCPHCGDFATFMEPLIRERLVDTGMARFVFYDFPLPQFPNSFLAARAARCANEQEKFWDYHDIIFARQPTWSGMGNPSEFFVEVAGEVGIDDAAFETCLRSDRFQDEVSRSLQLGQLLGVASTPSLFVNMKRLNGVPEIAELEQIVRAEMGALPVADSTAADASATATAPGQ